ncbi:MAG TPA: hypothetical protein VG870_05135 [Chitinophagaceae bacterium]|nr:hypothetical protein [Chitinophagaceae bacterium]
MLNAKYIHSLSADELWYLNHESVENPLAVLHRFFSAYGLMTPHERLWELVKICLGSPGTEHWTSAQRAGAIQFVEQLQELIKANYVLFLSLERKGPPVS